jgi:hypothetical protein
VEQEGVKPWWPSSHQHHVQLAAPMSPSQALKGTCWFIPLSKWVITPVISGFTLLIPFITGVINHLLSGMRHQVVS